MSIIEMRNVSKSFGKVLALDQVDLSVEKGDIYGFIGPNGAGKTTTIRVLLGIIKANEGKAKVFGKDAWKDSVEIHKNLAYVPGDVNLWPNLTGGEVIDLFVRLRGSNNKSKRQELIDRFQLDPSKKCRTYSKGNRQKVALIAALASDVDLYILDEPTSGLDPLMERVFVEYMMEAKAAGKTILLSSHILSEVDKLCNKVSIIREGKIIESGKLSELRHLTRTSMRIQTKKPIEGLHKLDGVYNIKEEGESVVLQVDQRDMDKLIKHISDYGVTHLESIPPTLEDLFMSHYMDNGGED